MSIMVFGILFPRPQSAPRQIPSSSTVEVSTLLSGLDVPWDLCWGPDNQIWYTEQAGKISRLDPGTGKSELLVHIPDVLRLTTPGLMSLAFHPDFKRQPYLFTNYTYRKDSLTIATKLVRYTYSKGKLSAPVILLEIPGHKGHNGSRIVISPDHKIMYATGDAVTITNAQSLASLNGKVLRLNLDGTVPADNPIKGSAVWSWGHRNIQGLVYSPKGILFSSEHGDATDDELNKILPGNNYGWPKVEGYCDQPREKQCCDSARITPPLMAWTPTIAPAGIAFYGSHAIPEWQGCLLMTTLKEADLRVLKPDEKGDKIISERIYLDQQYGRLRDVCVSPTGDVYVSTSNRDWNPGKGFPTQGDDRILRIRRKNGGIKLADLSGPVASARPAHEPAGKALYHQYCSSCHKEDGKGVAGVFPSLAGSPHVKGDKPVLLRIILGGISPAKQNASGKYDQQMPAFLFLKDEDIADIATYIRAGFENDSERVMPREVSKARQDPGK
ncbi:PQQ-dependent sugar dehydrogenase [Dyadobacter helix]|nr:PQQ-dependent sugar dehydrogenase [Dyadobacter sp. CECT 9275]